jgi:SNF2 family DNA or RNA helicase
MLLKANPPHLRTKLVETHKPHQEIFLAWALKQTEEYSGGLCGDTMGMGKSHEIISLIHQQRHILRKSKNQLETGATLLVVPATTLDAWYNPCRFELGKLDKREHCIISPSDESGNGSSTLLQLRIQLYK